MNVNLSICVIVRNESAYIEEWIAFHRLVGVERFYLYDDGSDDDTVQKLRAMDHGDIIVIPWNADPRYKSPVDCKFRATPQITAFNHWIHHYRHETRWAAFIDVDEFLFHSKQDDLNRALDQYSTTSAIAVQWLVFGSNGHKHKPSGLVTESYSKRGLVGQPEPWGRHCKVIARSQSLAYFGPSGSHNAVYLSGSCNDSWGIHVPGATFQRARLVEQLPPGFRLNHYYTKSLEEAKAKVERHDHNAIPGFQPNWERMHAHDVNNVEDLSIQRFLPQLKESLRCQFLSTIVTA